MAADLFSAVQKQFKFDEVDSDNWVFKLFYRASFSICLAGSILCVATTYIGNPITCDHPHTTISMDLIHQVKRAQLLGIGRGQGLVIILRTWVGGWCAVQASARSVCKCAVGVRYFSIWIDKNFNVVPL